MNNQNNYHPKTDGLNPRGTFDPKQGLSGGAKNKGNNANSTQNILQLAEIRDGVVIMNDGSFRVVIFCRPINFALMSEQERAAVEYSYQGFLNSLFFPIQIMVRSRRVDANNYIELLEEARQNQTNMLLGLAMEDYISFMIDLIANADIMDKFFYVIVPYNPSDEMSKDNIIKNTQGFFSKLFSFGQKPHQLVIDQSTINDAKRELRRRGQVVIEGLGQCGIMSTPLNTEELIELYYESYNPDNSSGHELVALKDLSMPMVTRGFEAEPPHTIPQTSPPTVPEIVEPSLPPSPPATTNPGLISNQPAQPATTQEAQNPTVAMATPQPVQPQPVSNNLYPPS